MFLQSVDGRCSMQMSAECYCFSNPSMSVLCADICGLLLFQRSVVEHCSVEMSADCYCFSCRTSSVALCIVSAVRSRALLCADVCGLLLFQRSEIEHSSVQMSADCYCFSGPKSRVALCRCLRTAIVSAVRSRALRGADVCGLLLFQQSEIEHCSTQMSADCYCSSSRMLNPHRSKVLPTAFVSAVATASSLQSSTSSGGRVVRR